VDVRPITNYGEENVDLLGRKKETCKEKYRKVKICRYCEILYPAELLSHKMTLKMIVDVDKHLLVIILKKL
jgi:hypothetical protein